MKLKLKLTVLLLAGIAIVYTACKKSSDSPSGPALSPSDVSSQIALDLSQDLFGGYGGIDLGSGLSGPTDFATKHIQNTRVLHDLDNPFCGLTIDTTLSATEKIGADSTIAVSGHVKFSFTCTNDEISGLSTDDNLSIQITTPQFSITSKIAESLVMSALNPQDDNSQLSLSGNLSSSSTYSYKAGNKSGTRSFSYVLNTLTLDPTNDDIVSGSATFTTKGSGSNGSWSFIGTIKFLGNHKVEISISGKTYTVDLDTGVVG